MKNTILIFASALLLTQCGGSGPATGSCSFTLAGDYTGTHGAVTLTDEHSGYKWFNCSGAATTEDYPQVSVGIRTEDFIGAGTYTVSGAGTNGVFLVLTASEEVYRANSSSINCTATFTSSTVFTFSCDNISKENNGGGNLSVSAGSFSL